MNPPVGVEQNICLALCHIFIKSPEQTKSPANESGGCGVPCVYLTAKREEVSDFHEISNDTRLIWDIQPKIAAVADKHLFGFRWTDK